MLLGLFLFAIFLVLFTVKFSMDLSVQLINFELNYTIRLRLGSHYLAVPAKMTTKMERMVGKQPLHGLEEILKNLEDVWSSLDNFLQEIQHLQLDVGFGLGDPFWTALSCGAIWAVVGSFLTGLANSNRLKTTPQITVVPDYGSINLYLSFYCIFRFRLGQIIIKELKRLVEE